MVDLSAQFWLVSSSTVRPTYFTEVNNHIGRRWRWAVLLVFFCAKCRLQWVTSFCDLSAQFWAFWIGTDVRFRPFSDVVGARCREIRNPMGASFRQWYFWGTLLGRGTKKKPPTPDLAPLGVDEVDVRMTCQGAYDLRAHPGPPPLYTLTPTCPLPS